MIPPNTSNLRPELCPTLNGWPRERIPEDDPESDRLLRVIDFFWNANQILTDLGQARSPHERQTCMAGLELEKERLQHLNHDLTRWAAFIEPHLENGIINDINYTCPRGIWNPEVTRYQVQTLSVDI